MQASDKSSDQQVSEALSNIVKAYSPRLRENPDCLPLLLGDFCPTLAAECYGLCAPLQIPRFRSALKLGTLNGYEIDAIGYLLIERFGFTEETAKWIQRSWKSALEATDNRLLDFEFSCPNCDFPGRVNARQATSIANCPSCKSKIEFGQNFKPTVNKLGWKRKRVRPGEWVFELQRGLLDNKSIRNNLSDQIRTRLLDEDISIESLVADLAVVDIVNVMTDQVADQLLRLQKRKNATGQSVIVDAILRTTFANSTLQLSAEFPHELAKSEGQFSVQIENLVAVVKGRLPNSVLFLVFGENDFGFIGETSQWQIPYRKITTDTVAFSTEKTKFTIGELNAVDVRGFGVPRRKLADVLVMLGICADRLSGHFGFGHQ